MASISKAQSANVDIAAFWGVHFEQHHFLFIASVIFAQVSDLFRTNGAAFNSPIEL